MNSKHTKFIVFALLLAGTIEAGSPVDKSSNDSFTFTGSYNPFTVSTCSTTDRYIQGTGKLNYDKRFHKNWEFHSAAAYSKSVKLSHDYNASEIDEGVEEDSPTTLRNSGYLDAGMSFWWDYLHIRTDFSVFMWDEYRNNRRDNVNVLPMGRGLIEAGKMNLVWVSTGFMHPEFPDGVFQLALSGNIEDKAILGVGFVWLPLNITTFQNIDAGYSLFMHTRIKFDDNAYLRSYLNIKPAFHDDVLMMFDFSLGFEFRF